jgi:hypothetical protein
MMISIVILKEEVFEVIIIIINIQTLFITLFIIVIYINIKSTK